MITSTTIPSLSLKKKHNAIGYHCVREAIAARIVDLLHVASKENLADILTKPLGLQQYLNLMAMLQFPLIRISKPDGECQIELNESVMNGVTSDSYSRITNDTHTAGMSGTSIGVSDWSTT